MPEILRIYTMGSAYGGFAETTTGSPEPGKLADLVVWSHDVYSLSPEDVNDLAAEMTIAGGEVVYDAQKL
jgi:predicted amidohydrolase YtcJ